jgi:hypothetical protein
MGALLCMTSLTEPALTPSKNKYSASFHPVLRMLLRTSFLLGIKLTWKAKGKSQQKKPSDWEKS